MRRVGEKSLVSRIQTPHKRLNEESVILNLDDGNYFATNEIGIDIREKLDGRSSVEEIGRLISEKYDVRERRAVSDTLDFIKSLVKAKLATVDS